MEFKILKLYIHIRHVMVCLTNQEESLSMNVRGKTSCYDEAKCGIKIEVTYLKGINMINLSFNNGAFKSP